MQYYPVFDTTTRKFIGIYRRRMPLVSNTIQVACLLGYTKKEASRYSQLMEEIKNAWENDRDSNLTYRDHKFIKNYNCFYIVIQSTLLHKVKIGLINLASYSKTNKEYIKEFLSFKCNHFDKKTP